MSSTVNSLVDFAGRPVGAAPAAAAKQVWQPGCHEWSLEQAELAKAASQATDN